MPIRKNYELIRIIIIAVKIIFIKISINFDSLSLIFFPATHFQTSRQWLLKSQSSHPDLQNRVIKAKIFRSCVVRHWMCTGRLPRSVRKVILKFVNTGRRQGWQWRWRWWWQNLITGTMMMTMKMTKIVDRVTAARAWIDANAVGLTQCPRAWEAKSSNEGFYHLTSVIDSPLKIKTEANIMATLWFYSCRLCAQGL